MIAAVVALLIFLTLGILGSIIETKQAYSRRREYIQSRAKRVLKKRK